MSALFAGYGALAAAIVLETIGTTFLQLSQQFTRPLPTVVMAVAYLGSFYFLSITLRFIPVGIAYAVWSGLGVVLITCIGLFVFHQKLDAPALLGLGLIISGVVVLNVFSKTITHG